jgi:hypothetical protein
LPGRPERHRLIPNWSWTDLPPTLDLALELARRYCTERFPSAAALLAGSVARGTATPASDLDLVLVFERLGNAWRETVTINGITAEIFAHDPETLAWFFDQDREAGTGSLAAMLSEAVAVAGPPALLVKARKLGEAALALGPPPLDAAALAGRRYIVADLAEDLRGGGTPGEIIALAARTARPRPGVALRACLRLAVPPRPCRPGAGPGRGAARPAGRHAAGRLSPGGPGFLAKEISDISEFREVRGFSRAPTLDISRANPYLPGTHQG